MEGLTIASALTEEELQVLGALPFDLSRANAKALALLDGLWARKLIERELDSQTLRRTDAGASALSAALQLERMESRKCQI